MINCGRMLSLTSDRVKGRPNYYSTKREEYAHIRFDLDAGKRSHSRQNHDADEPDFSSLFNWNTKQLFVWVTARYPSNDPSPAAPKSEAVIWDSIINSKSQLKPFSPFQYIGQQSPKPRKASSRKTSSKKEEKTIEPGIIRLKNSKPKYQITDITGVISDQHNVTLEIGWNLQPWVGALTWTQREGRDFGRWKGVNGGRSEVFDLPSLKGKKPASETVVSAGGRPEAAEASGII